jgi:hypothetical protein
MCQEFVKKRLLAPSTVQFGEREDTTVKRTDRGTFTVVGWLEAQNAFGTQVRNQYKCELVNTDSDEWGLVDIEIR